MALSFWPYQHETHSEVTERWILTSFDFKPFDMCESCLMGKTRMSHFTGKGERACDLLGLIHIDVCEPMSIKVMGQFGYFITFNEYCTPNFDH